jgi:hypothetical protein
MGPSQRAFLLSLAAIATLLVAPPVAAAEVFTVTRNDDPTPGACLPADCSLREALAASNASTAVDDQIVVPASAAHYAVDLEFLEITDQVEIRGEGADRSVLDGDGNNVIFQNQSPGVLIVGLSITGGEGGIQSNGELTLRRVSVDHNVRPAGAGGIQSNSPLLIDSSFIGFNQAGGATGGAIQANAPVTIVNSTLAGNTSDGPAAIIANDVLTISSSAIVSNVSSSTTDETLRGTSLRVRDSIFAANRNQTGPVDCAGPVASLGGNVEDIASCAVGAGDRPNTNPGLGTLALHGGTTLLYSLIPGSAAIDAAKLCPPLDQRGAPRPLGAGCDSGPFELQPTTLPPAAVDRELSVLIGTGKLRLNRRGIARLKLSCPGAEASPPCSGKVVLTTRARVRFGGRKDKLRLAAASFSIGAGMTASLALKLPHSKAELVRGARVARPVLAEVQAADAAGNTRVIRKPLTLVPR